MRPSTHAFAACLRPLALMLVLAGCNAHTNQTDVTKTPVGLESALRLSEAASAGGDHGAALLILDSTIEKYPQQAAPKIALAETYFSMGALPEAAAVYDQLVEDEQAGAAALTGLGRLALREDQPAVAESYFAEALVRQPNDTAALNGRAVALDLMGAHADAQAIYTTILTREPANRAVLVNRALSLALSGNAEGAVAALAPLSSGPMAIPEAIHNLALANAMAGNLREAERILRQELDPDATRETMRFYRQLARL